jgi:hypothetical protein
MAALTLGFLTSFSLVPLARGAGGLLAYEPFNGAPGALHQTSGGQGWAAPWSVQNGDTSVPGYNLASTSPLIASDISQPGNYATGGSAWITAGRSLDTSATGNFASLLSGGLIGASGQSLYFGVLLRKDVNTEDELSTTLHPGNNPAWWPQYPGVGVGYFSWSSNANGLRYWSLKLDGVVHTTNVPVVVGQAAYLVVRMDFGSPTSTVSLYVNPQPSALPANPDTVATTTNSIAFQSIAWFAGPNAGESSLDEIRFASAYAPLMSGNAPPPAAPTGLSATPGNGQVSLSWNSVAGASAYTIYHVVNGVAAQEGTSTSATFVDGGLTNGQVYTFAVTAVSSSGVSGLSGQVTAVPRGPAPPAHTFLGTNINQFNDYSRELPFVDAFKTARPWISQMQGASWGGGPALSLDANGWILSLQPGQYAETIMLDNALDDQAHYPAGQYTLLYDGDGTIAFDLNSASITSQTPGRIVATVPAGQTGVFLMVTATNPSNPIRNIRFIMPGFEATYQQQPFNPQFLQRLSGYKALRFMETMGTNGSTLKNWSDRPLPTDYTYGWRGVPAEVLVQLANTAGLSPWFNMPAMATDDFMRQFAGIVSQQLNAGLPFYLEYSNETWNSAFSQNSWIATQGQTLGFSSDPVVAAADYTAYRSVQMFNIFQSVLGGSAAGSTSRMIRVIASQAGNSWLSDQTLGFQNAFTSADYLAIAPYFNCDDTATGGFGVLGDPSTASQVAAMTVDQVIDIELAHINGCAYKQMQSNSAVASKYGLRMIAYEGGQSLVGYNGAENNTTLTSLFETANRSPRMTALYAQYLANWVAAGGDGFIHYSNVTAYTKYGSWGALEYEDQDPATAPKYQALMTFASQH